MSKSVNKLIWRLGRLVESGAKQLKKKVKIDFFWNLGRRKKKIEKKRQLLYG